MEQHVCELKRDWMEKDNHWEA